MKTYYIVYRTTHLQTGKVYIGTHRTTNLNDGYLGSGKYLKYAVAKHGRESFGREILFVYDNPKDMYAKEAELVNEDFLSEANTYNIRLGGFGGFDHINNTDTYEDRVKRANTTNKIKRQRYRDDPEYRKRWQAQAREACRKGLESQRNNPNHVHNSFAGKKHTEEAKRKIGQKNSLLQKGEKNSQYGTCWIYHENQQTNKKIPKGELNEWLEIGWTKGRKMFNS